MLRPHPPYAAPLRTLSRTAFPKRSVRCAWKPVSTSLIKRRQLSSSGRCHAHAHACGGPAVHPARRRLSCGRDRPHPPAPCDRGGRAPGQGRLRTHAGSAPGAWLRENGLTAAEAARIQPAYGSPYADFTGRWEGTMTFGPHDSLTLRYVLTNNGNETWTLTLPGRPPIQTRVVALAGDNLITQAESVASILGSERVMTRLRAMLHYGGHTLTGSIEVRYPPPSGAVVRGRTRATLDCPGTDSPKAVVAFVRRAGLPKVRCVTEIGEGALLGGEGTVHQVTYRSEG